MQDIERELRLKQLRLILIIMLFIFVSMLSYTIYWCVDYQNKYGNFQQTDAKVIEHKVIDEVEYDVLRYQIGDGIYLDKTTKYPSKNEINDIITIYFDPDNPIDVIYSHNNVRIVLPIICIVFGVAIISLIVVYFLLIIDNGKKRKTNKQKNPKAKKHLQTM